MQQRPRAARHGSATVAIDRTESRQAVLVPRTAPVFRGVAAKSMAGHRFVQIPFPIGDPCELGWSTYGAERTPPRATERESGRRENASNRPNPLRSAAISCEHNEMVRRGSTVRVRQRALTKAPQPAGFSNECRRSYGLTRPSPACSAAGSKIRRRQFRQSSSCHSAPSCAGKTAPCSTRSRSASCSAGSAGRWSRSRGPRRSRTGSDYADSARAVVSGALTRDLARARLGACTRMEPARITAVHSLAVRLRSS
jgi:hypothetical protein